MILHLFPYEKFTYDYIERINKLFDPNQHLFFVYGNCPNEAIRKVKSKNVVMECQSGNMFRWILFLFKNITRADKVIIHSLFMNTKYFAVLVFLQPLMGKKYFWCIWGADLYNAYWERKNSRKEFLRVFFIKHLPAVVSIEGDYEFLKAHYKTKAKLFWASYSFDFFVPEKQDFSGGEETINILLGNSATPECRYENAIDMLTPYKDKDILVSCILSYPEGNEEYRNHIIQYGKQKLGEKFIPVTGFMPYEEYTEMLEGIDIAIFNHNRQQAFGNIASLLYLGKKVFISPENTCKGFFEKMGAEVYSTEDFSENAVVKNNDKEFADKNRRVIDLIYSDAAFKECWQKIFASEMKV